MEVARRIGGRDSHPDLHRVHADARPYATPAVESKRGGSRQGASARQVTDSRPRCGPAYLRSPGLVLASRMFRAGMKRPLPITVGVARRYETTGGQTARLVKTIPSEAWPSRSLDRRSVEQDSCFSSPIYWRSSRPFVSTGVAKRSTARWPGSGSLRYPRKDGGVHGRGRRSRPFPRPARVRRRRGNACTCAPIRTGMARCG